MNWEELLSFKRLGKQKPEVSSSAQIRSEFEKDYDRIIFSQPFRSLQDKTQVLPLPEEDFVHNRLTHSLETASVGRSLGKQSGDVLVKRHPKLSNANISSFDFGSIVSAACLAHDVGNPPFGHSGESAISDFFRSDPEVGFLKDEMDQFEWEDLCNFEGNAQGFRILCNQGHGKMQLTFSTLAAFVKYPRESILFQKQKGRASQKKFGFFQSDKATFSEIAKELGLIELSNEQLSWGRHPLTFLVEAADNICYHIIDLEDGARLGFIPHELAVELLADILKENFQPQKLKSIKSRNEQISVLRAVVINQLIREITATFLDMEEDILKGAFDEDLFNHIESSKALNNVISESISRYYRSRPVLEIEASGFEVLGGLLKSFVLAAHQELIQKKPAARSRSIHRLLPIETRSAIEQNPTSYSVVQGCLDYVAGLSDRSSISLFRKIKGISFQGN